MTTFVTTLALNRRFSDGVVCCFPFPLPSFLSPGSSLYLLSFRRVFLLPLFPQFASQWTVCNPVGAFSTESTAVSAFNGTSSCSPVKGYAFQEFFQLHQTVSHAFAKVLLKKASTAERAPTRLLFEFT